MSDSQQNQTPRRRLTREERETAEEIAVELYAACNTGQAVQRVLADHFAIPMAQAKELAIKARRKLYEAEVTAVSLSDRKVEHEKLIKRLYRTAEKKGHLRVCEALLRQLAALHQLNAPTRIEVSHRADPFEERSEAELEHFVEHGCWPEERSSVH